MAWVWLMAAGLVGFGNDILRADVPVITNPADIHYLDSNTALDPLGSNTWAIKAPLPTGRAGAATAAAGDKIYVIGGEVIDTCTTVNVVEAYDPATDQWITGLSPLPLPGRWRPSAATLDGLIYVLGGESTGDICGEVLDLVEVYDPATDTWSDKASIPSPRLQIGVAVDSVNHLIYAVGGSTASPDFNALKTVEVYDSATNTWTPKHDLNIARGFPAVAVIGGKVYAIGGQDAHHATVNTVEIYDPVTDTWTTSPSLVPFPRLNSASAVIDDKVYIVGGEVSTDGLLSSLQIYDPSQDCRGCGNQPWTIGVSMPTARTFLGAAALNNVLYALGGEAALARVSQEFTYQITATNNPTSYDASPLPDGLMVDKVRGIISGVPTTSVRDFHVSFVAANADGTGPPKDVSLFIAPAPKIPPGTPSFVSSTCITGRAGEPFSFQVLTDDTSAAAQIAATGLPYLEGVGSQLTIDPGTGVISGTVPTTSDGTAQSFGVTLNIADGRITTQSFLELTFVSDPDTPVITSPSSRTLTLNEFFTYTITADAAAASFDYIGLDGLLNGALPTGLTFDPATSTISGIYGGNQLFSQVRPNEHSTLPSSDDPDTIKKEPPPHIQLLSNNNLGGAGIAPLNFVLSLHDFEAEILEQTTSVGTGYVIFSDDPQASGGAAGLLQSTQTGEFVSYTIPQVAAGTYDLKVGTKRDNTAGIFQVMIDGRNQGPAEDEYAATSTFETRDLGTITFRKTADRTFTFQIVGKNEASNGYELVVDYVDLVPHPEAEALVVQGSSAPYANKRDPNLSGGAGTLLKAKQVGDYLTYTLPVMTAGTYNINVGTKTDTNRGIFQLSIDGINQGYTQNEYSSTAGYKSLDLGAVSLSAGDKALTFSVTGKDAASTGYQLLFDYISLTLSTHLEAEALNAHGTARLTHITDPNLSGGSGVLLNAIQTGQYVTYTVNIPVAGTYHIKLGAQTSDQCGIFQLAINGRDQGLPQDEYSASTGYAVLDLGSITFTQPGNKTFRFTVTGQNPDSLGYQLSFDYLGLVR